MSKPAAIPLFGDAYLADTQHLTTEEHGAYLLLMMAAWRQDDCSLPLDDRKLARIAGLSTRKWGVIKETILEFWTVENGRIHQARLRKEHTYVRQKSESNRKSAESRWRAQVSENKQDTPMRSQCEGNAPPPPPKVSKEEVAKATPSSARARPKRNVGIDIPIPDDWKPNLGPEAQRIVDGWPPGHLEREAFAFRNHAVANGRLQKNWDAAFCTWITKSDERMNGNGRQNQNHRANHAGPGAVRDNRDGIARALDRRLGLDDPAGEAGRRNLGAGEGNRPLAIAARSAGH